MGTGTAVATDREERVARNESLFRAANERIAKWEERARADAVELYFCECADPRCNQKVSMRVAEYERIRSKPDRFFVVRGHELADLETVVESHEAWVVVEKVPGVEETVEGTDPRHHGG